MDHITTQPATDTSVLSGEYDGRIEATTGRDEEAPWDRARLVRELKAEALVNDRPRLALAALHIEDDDGAHLDHTVSINSDASLIVARAMRRTLKRMRGADVESASLIAYDARYLRRLAKLATELARDMERATRRT